MKEIKIPAFIIGRGIEYEICSVSEKEDIQNALKICKEIKKKIKSDSLNIDEFLKKTDKGDYYILNDCELPIAFSEKAIFMDGFKNCLKRLINRLREIEINEEEICALKILCKPNKKTSY